MELIQLTILSLIQGLTEFLPISSSAHLILVSTFMSWPDQGITVDIFAHFGTLLAVIFYFREDLKKVIKTFNLFEKNNLGLNLLLATMPIVFIGFIFNSISNTKKPLKKLYLNLFVFIQNSFPIKIWWNTINRINIGSMHCQRW